MTQIPAHSEPARILVVDDEDGIRAFVSDVLKGEGYEVTQALSGEEGVSLLGRNPFDLVLVDLRLPGMDGMSVVRQAREAGAEAAFVVMTGHGSVESAIEALREGVADYLPKPFRPNELLRIVGRVLEHRRVLRENLALRESLALYEVVKAIAASADLDEILGLIVQAIKQVTEAEQVVAFIQGVEGELLPAAGTEKVPPEAELERFARAALVSREPTTQTREQGARTGYPLRAKDQTVGVLVADHPARPRRGAAPGHQATSLLAEIAAIAIHKARLVASLEKSLHRIEEQQAQLIQGSKLSIIGEMAAGIAHEIRNPLSAITLGCELLAAEAGEKAAGGPGEQSPTEARALETILAASKRLAEVVDNLVGFSRKQGPAKGPVEVARLLEKTRSLVRYHLSKQQVQWVDDGRGGGGRILGNEGQLQQVLLNLILNACDAMPGGGTLVLGTAPANLPRPPGSPALAISVQDSGQGIPEENIERIFEPFFTTKGERGTGLGLMISRSLVQEHGGTLTVESTPGVGTTFTLTLPLFNDEEGAGG